MKRSIHPFNRGRLFKGFPAAGIADRSGVALILVIGLLALMVVMGVTFSIFMRTERVAAGNFRNDVVARQLLYVALNRAIVAIDSDLRGKAYPPWPYLESGPTNGTLVLGVTNAPAMDWIPRAALGPNPNPQPRWIDLSNGLSNMIEGRVGFLVVNCSGLLDVNNSGSNGVSRSIGTNINEIQLSVCQDVSNVLALVADRPYETVQELGVLGSGALSQPVSNFVSYSLFPTGYPNGTNITLIDLSGDDHELELLSRKTNIINGLIACGFTNSGQAGFIFTNLLDYVDTNFIPRDLGSACTESVPMFNEICVQSTYSFNSSTNCRILFGLLKIEWFYPFVKASAVSNYWIECNVSFGDLSSGLFPLPASLSTNINANFRAAPYPATYPYVSFSTPWTNYSAFIGATQTLNARISLQMHADNPGGPVVDATPYPTNLTLDIRLPSVVAPVPPSVGSSPKTVAIATNRECIDPRFNWLPSSSHWPYTTNPPASWSTDNAKTWDYFNGVFGAYGLYSDKHFRMYVADRPLVSVTELTYLLRGQSLNPDCRWNTIRLFDCGGTPSIDRILDYFTLGTNTPTRGFVNPNSGIQDVLTAVFKGMPLNNYPGETNDPPLNLDEARVLAAFWANTNQNQNPWRCNFGTLSDIGHATNVFNLGLPGGLTPFQKESFFRNTAGLFNTRQQYFMILLFSQATKKVEQLADKSVVAGVRGIAEVWRDPLPNAEGIHPCLVRMVHLLNNE